jgi:hypothetical protein
MDLTIHYAFLPHDDPEASLAFYGVRDCAVRDPSGTLIRINELR